MRRVFPRSVRTANARNQRNNTTVQRARTTRVAAPPAVDGGLVLLVGVVQQLFQALSVDPRVGQGTEQKEHGTADVGDKGRRPHGVIEAQALCHTRVHQAPAAYEHDGEKHHHGKAQAAVDACLPAHTLASNMPGCLGNLSVAHHAVRHQKDHKEQANKGVNVRVGVTGHVADSEHTGPALRQV